MNQPEWLPLVGCPVARPLSVWLPLAGCVCVCLPLAGCPVAPPGGPFNGSPWWAVCEPDWPVPSGGSPWRAVQWLPLVGCLWAWLAGAVRWLPLAGRSVAPPGGLSEPDGPVTPPGGLSAWLPLAGRPAAPPGGLSGSSPWRTVRWLPLTGHPWGWPSGGMRCRQDVHDAGRRWLVAEPGCDPVGGGVAVPADRGAAWADRSALLGARVGGGGDGKTGDAEGPAGTRRHRWGG